MPGRFGTLTTRETSSSARTSFVPARAPPQPAVDDVTDNLTRHSVEANRAERLTLVRRFLKAPLGVAAHQPSPATAVKASLKPERRRARRWVASDNSAACCEVYVCCTSQGIAMAVFAGKYGRAI